MIAGVYMSEDKTNTNWQERHVGQEQRKTDIRNRIQEAGRNYEEARKNFRPAKPAPSIDDDEPKRVAVYARVSTSSEEQVSSIENQTLYYEKKIAENPNWKLQNIYSDEGKSGTSIRHRDAFRQMLTDAKNQEMDMIICASVSRFARNISDCLDQVARLKSFNPSHPVGVYFETENIYTLNPDGDQALGIHALLADWESANKSRRMILSYDQRIMTGQYPVADLLGYRHTKDGKLNIEPEEAKTVKFIFLAYVLGMGSSAIAEFLTQKNRPTLQGKTTWNSNMVRAVLFNERRWGDLEARKTIVTDYKLGINKANDGERCSAYVENHHEAIVSPEIAKAAALVCSSIGSTRNGVTDIKIIPKGALKGFISINPSWKGINRDVLNSICKDVYGADELDSVMENNGIIAGFEHSKVSRIDFHGYQVPYGAGFITHMTPTLTITTKNIRFNKTCHERLGKCKCIEIGYNPLLQMIIVREGSDSSSTSIIWQHDDGKTVGTMSSRVFSSIVYENMGWKKSYSFRFRGITKERNNRKIMFFFLDDPLVIPDKKDKTANKCVEYIDIYDAEARSIGVSMKDREKRSRTLSNITRKDIEAEGKLVTNPLIGQLPDRKKIAEELNALVASM